MVAPDYIRDGDVIVKDPNRRVQEAIMRAFTKFQALGSIRQTYGWFMENQIELPVRMSMDAVRWRKSLSVGSCAQSGSSGLF